MSFVTLIFGNGLGRAVDNKFFALDKGIHKVWNDSGSLKIKKEIKESILSCLPKVGGRKPLIPESEEQLQKLHEVSNYCKRLREIEPDDPVWLTEVFKEFPEAVDEFIAKVSYHFHTYVGLEFHDEYIAFVDSLSKFIKSYCCHLATLNYDNLLYQPLIESGVLSGYSGHLIDGFNGAKFNSDFLVRKEHQRNKLGWYLHLHGTPLFYEDRKNVRKLNQRNLADSFTEKPLKRRHVVLRHANDKPEIIDASKILKTYWRFLSKALRQSSWVYIVGYGGADEHLNREVATWAEQCFVLGKDFTVKVVERKTEASDKTRKEYWSSKLSIDEFIFPVKNIEIERLDNILSFDWGKE